MDDDDERPTLALRLDDGPTEVILDHRLAPGTDVGGYIVDGELGHGGMGVVYSATHPVIGKRAAVKVLKPDLSRDHRAVERFVLEARAVNQIGHPNIVDIFAFGALPDGRSYFVMDLLAGESLRARIRRGPLHLAEAASVIDETASALMAAHAKGIVHRDLKPDNVFVVIVPGRSPEVKLLDWGLAKLAPAVGGKQRTLAGSVLGTPVYMSPEQARASGDVDHRTDIYALGVMSYELIAGAVPFKKGSSLDTMLAHQDEPVPPLLAKVPMLPEEVAQLIEAMLAKEPDGRPTLAAVRTVLKRLKGSKKIPSMTAAGLQFDSALLEPMFEQPDPSLAPPTVNEQRRSQEVTSPRLPSSRPSTAPPMRSHPRAPTPLPLPAPDRPSNPGMSAQFPMTVVGYSAPDPYQQSWMPPPAPRNTRDTSWLIIAIAAIIASAIGVVIALAI